jgi:hypothetical protein
MIGHLRLAAQGTCLWLIRVFGHIHQTWGGPRRRATR